MWALIMSCICILVRNCIRIYSDTFFLIFSPLELNQEFKTTCLTELQILWHFFFLFPRMLKMPVFLITVQLLSLFSDTRIDAVFQLLKVLTGHINQFRCIQVGSIWLWKRAGGTCMWVPQKEQAEMGRKS